MQPLIVHGGEISKTVIAEYSDKFDFIQTENGIISYNCIGRCVDYVQRYVCHER